MRPPPAPRPASKAEPDIVADLDITPENIAFRDGEAYALIDFDLVRPSTRVDRHRGSAGARRPPSAAVAAADQGLTATAA
jgi:hypothetical protein